jgi:hypothetical protein
MYGETANPLMHLSVDPLHRELLSVVLESLHHHGLDAFHLNQFSLKCSVSLTRCITWGCVLLCSMTPVMRASQRCHCVLSPIKTFGTMKMNGSLFILFRRIQHPAQWHVMWHTLPACGNVPALLRSSQSTGGMLWTQQCDHLPLAMFSSCAVNRFQFNNPCTYENAHSSSLPLYY